MGKGRGRLGKHLDLPIPSSKKLSEQLDGARTQIGAKVMPNRIKDPLINRLSDSIHALDGRPKGDAKKTVKQDAAQLGKDAAEALKLWTTVSKRAVDRIERLRQEGEKVIIEPATRSLGETGLKPDAVPAIRQFHEAYGLAVHAIGTIDLKGPITDAVAAQEMSTTLDRIADRFENTLNEIRGLLPRDWSTSAGQVVKKIRASTDLDAEVTKAAENASATLERIKAMSGDPGAAKPIQDRLGKLPKPPFNDVTGPQARDSAVKLATDAEDHLQKLVADNKKALGPRQEKLDDYEKRLQTVFLTSGLEGAGLVKGGKPHSKEIDRLAELATEQLDQARLCLDQAISGPGLDVLDKVLETCAKHLVEAETLTPKAADEMADKKEKAEELSRRSKLFFFDTDLQKYAPRTAALLKAEVGNMKDDTAELSSADKDTRYGEILHAAEQAQKDAADLKDLCTVKAKKVLEDGQRNLKLLDGKAEDGKFYGNYAEAVLDLESELDFGPEGPDRGAIEAAMKALATQWDVLAPGGKPDDKAIKDSNDKGLDSKRDRDKLLNDLKASKGALGDLLKTLKAAVDKAKPGDVNAYGDLVRDREELDDRSKPVLDALGSGLIKGIKEKIGRAGLDDRNIDGSTAEMKKLLEDYARLTKRVTNLTNEPGGRVCLSPEELTKSWEIFDKSLKAAMAELGEVKEAADRLMAGQDGEVAKLKALVDNTLKQLGEPQAGIKSAADTLKARSTPEAMPARLKARETGLAAVRRYRDVWRSDPVLTKLRADEAFPHEGIDRLEFAVDNLDLNFNRGI